MNNNPIYHIEDREKYQIITKLPTLIIYFPVFIITFADT